MNLYLVRTLEENFETDWVYVDGCYPIAHGMLSDLIVAETRGQAHVAFVKAQDSRSGVEFLTPVKTRLVAKDVSLPAGVWDGDYVISGYYCMLRVPLTNGQDRYFSERNLFEKRQTMYQMFMV